MLIHHLGFVPRKSYFVACQKQRFRPACTSAQSDLNLYYSLSGKYLFLCKIFYILSTLCGWTDWFEPYLVANPNDRISCVGAHIVWITDSWNISHSMLLLFWGKTTLHTKPPNKSTYLTYISQFSDFELYLFRTFDEHLYFRVWFMQYDPKFHLILRKVWHLFSQSTRGYYLCSSLGCQCQDIYMRYGLIVYLRYQICALTGTEYFYHVIKQSNLGPYCLQYHMSTWDSRCQKSWVAGKCVK